MPSGSRVRGDPRLIQVATPVAVLVTAFVGVRFSLRYFRRTGFWFDDWFILASLILVWGMYTVSVLSVEIGGVGTPFEVNRDADPSMAWLGNFLKLLFAGQIIYASTILTAKLSILALYWRLFPTAFMKRGCVVLAALTGMWATAGVLVDVFQCTPMSKAFDPSIETEGDCISQTGYCLGMIIPNILIDIMILSLPTFEVAKLHLPRSQRIALGSVFLLGAGVCAASGVRMYYHLELVRAGATGDLDLAMSIFYPQLWMTLEPDMAIICACLPVMRPLVTMLLASQLYRSFASYLGSAGTGGGSSSARNSKRRAASNTIGGSSMAPSSMARREGMVRSDNRASTFRASGYELSSFDSLEYLQDEDVEAGRDRWDGRGWRPSQGGYGIGCQTQVSRSRSVGPDEIPLGAISVKTVVDCRETTCGPDARSGTREA
ncbi:hypothetical protein KVR01_013519 [Diaporthe batatas]|uniref:uncharacterized protein n=1 Tax=Diaporthe batatas TaxID=748121 RepID=UPI001D04A60C|nr:uncharacterized protein KVR01_013519 [Diaporthe batatas]KAG8156568.1 hypothetical protein KVR01_013519 [Diaporthe batatas]